MVAMNPADRDPLDQVRRILQGGTIAIVGGDQRRTHVERLSQAFELDGLLWVPTRESDASSRRFAAVIRREELTLVVSLHGLLRHQHTHDLRAMCRRFNIPLLSYWRSPHPAGLAAALVAQHMLDAIRARRGR
ncbi:MAG: hypothetical protein HUU19_07560 [Phycisphaerales bacterium]|nr:hypothetical protein [Phycisphaerales bacterium]